jgi:hypothetical protein
MGTVNARWLPEWLEIEALKEELVAGIVLDMLGFQSGPRLVLDGVHEVSAGPGSQAGNPG